MAITVATNSWVTIAEASAYLDDKYGAEGWAALPDATKSQLLITAFWAIYSNKKYSIPKSSTNELVKNAQIETAWFYYTYDSEIWKRRALMDMGVTEFQISKFREKFSVGDILPFVAVGMLTDSAAALTQATFTRELD